jgi:predicted dehydrogenase
MGDLRFAIFGTGFWSRFQLAAWRQLKGAECAALYNRTRSKAEALGREFGISHIYDDPEELLARERLDFMDIITDPGTHGRFVHMAAEHRLPVICQKPMAPDLRTAEQMVEACRQAGVPLFIHENWRWQTPIRAFKRELETAPVGKPFRAHVQYLSTQRVWDSQPFLKELDQFIVTDMGSHILDVARFLFGEAESLLCHTNHINDELKGEDNATVMMRMGRGTTVICEFGYASITERERPYQTYVFAECERGSVELGPDYWVRTTTREGTAVRQCPPPHYPWAEAERDIVLSSIVPCNANLLAGLAGKGKAETTGEDNLRTMRLVFAAYDSAARGETVRL